MSAGNWRNPTKSPPKWLSSFRGGSASKPEADRSPIILEHVLSDTGVEAAHCIAPIACAPALPALPDLVAGGTCLGSRTTLTWMTAAVAGVGRSESFSMLNRLRLDSNVGVDATSRSLHSDLFLTCS